MASRRPLPRLHSFGKRGSTSLSPDDMKVNTSVGGPSVAPNENAGRKEEMPKKRRDLFTQKYYRQSMKHPDYLFGNPEGLQSRQEGTPGRAQAI